MDGEEFGLVLGVLAIGTLMLLIKFLGVNDGGYSYRGYVDGFGEVFDGKEEATVL